MHLVAVSLGHSRYPNPTSQLLSSTPFALVKAPNSFSDLQRFLILVSSCNPTSLLIGESAWERMGVWLNEAKQRWRQLSPAIELVQNLTPQFFEDCTELESLGSDDEQFIPPDETDIAYLQYTSGSTSDAKGVVVRYGQLKNNVTRIGEHLQWKSATEKMVLWLPINHDMGLVAGVFCPFFWNMESTALTPEQFMRRPANWLSAIHHAGTSCDLATVNSAAPNFAYEYCVDRITLKQSENWDLSSWRIAVCGAEPVKMSTMKRFYHRFKANGFRFEAFMPSYGLAEAVLMVSGIAPDEAPKEVFVKYTDVEQHRFIPCSSEAPDTKSFVCCGKPLPGFNVKIIDTDTALCCAPQRIGEICINGDMVTEGYYQKYDPSLFVYIKNQPYLRTGDLGAIHEGELYITGRLKEMLIVKGRNIYPLDIENSIQQVYEQGRFRTCVVALRSQHNIEKSDADDVIAIQEIPRSFDTSQYSNLVEKIRLSVAQDYRISLFDVVLVPTRTIRLTTSGKARRIEMGRLYEKNELPQNYSSRKKITLLSEKDSKNYWFEAYRAYRIERRARAKLFNEPLGHDSKWRYTWCKTIVKLLSQHAQTPYYLIDLDTPIGLYGVDSLSSVQIIVQLEAMLGVDISSESVVNLTTLRSLLNYPLSKPYLESVNRKDNVQQQTIDSKDFAMVAAVLSCSWNINESLDRFDQDKAMPSSAPGDSNMLYDDDIRAIHAMVVYGGLSPRNAQQRYKELQHTYMALDNNLINAIESPEEVKNKQKNWHSNLKIIHAETANMPTIWLGMHTPFYAIVIMHLVSLYNDSLVCIVGSKKQWHGTAIHKSKAKLIGVDEADFNTQLNQALALKKHLFVMVDGNPIQSNEQEGGLFNCLELKTEILSLGIKHQYHLISWFTYVEENQVHLKLLPVKNMGDELFNPIESYNIFIDQLHRLPWQWYQWAILSRVEVVYNEVLTSDLRMWDEDRLLIYDDAEDNEYQIIFDPLSCNVWQLEKALLPLIQSASDKAHLVDLLSNVNKSEYLETILGFVDYIGSTSIPPIDQYQWST